MGEKPPQSDGVRTWSENLDRLGDEFTDFLARRHDAENLILRVMWSTAGLLSIVIAAVFAIAWWSSSTAPGGASGPGTSRLLDPGVGGGQSSPRPSWPFETRPTPASPAPSPQSTPAPGQTPSGASGAPVVISSTPVAAVIAPAPAPAPTGVTGLVGSLLHSVENLAGDLLGG